MGVDFQRPASTITRQFTRVRHEPDEYGDISMYVRIGPLPNLEPSGRGGWCFDACIDSGSC